MRQDTRGWSLQELSVPQGRKNTERTTGKDEERTSSRMLPASVCRRPEAGFYSPVRSSCFNPDYRELGSNVRTLTVPLHSFLRSAMLSEREVRNCRSLTDRCFPSAATLRNSFDAYRLSRPSLPVRHGRVSLPCSPHRNWLISAPSRSFPHVRHLVLSKAEHHQRPTSPQVFEHIASPLSGHFRSPEPRCDIIETKVRPSPLPRSLGSPSPIRKRPTSSSPSPA